MHNPDIISVLYMIHFFLLFTMQHRITIIYSDNNKPEVELDRGGGTSVDWCTQFDVGYTNIQVFDVWFDVHE